ncbi:hypothetical protein [Flavobacterium sp.]|uniref:hypothetical protein n=1 Tax=Flavobacterium sp. TaxID=239 RepID=UPI003919785A
MKAAFIPCLLFVFISSYSQQLIKYSFDNDVSIQLPKNSVITDTLGQKMIKGNIGGVNVIFLRTSEKDSTVTIENKSELIEFYSGFQKGYAQSVNGKIVSSKVIDKGHLKASEFQCQSKISTLNITIDGLVVFLNNYSYTIQFFNMGAEIEDYETQKKSILASLKFREGLSIDNQMTNAEESSMGYKIGEVIGYFLGVAVLIILILMILKKNKDKRLPRA